MALADVMMGSDAAAPAGGPMDAAGVTAAALGGAPPVGPGQNQSADGKIIPREPPQIAPERAALVKDVLKEIHADEKHWEEAFKRIEVDIKFAANVKGAQWDGDESKYVANLVARHIKERTDALYAKNPRCRAKRKQRLDFALWDGSIEQLQMALAAGQKAVQAGMQAAQQAGPEVGMAVAAQTMPDPALELLKDIQDGQNRRKMLDRVGKTLEILFHHFLDAPQPRFKTQAKQLVRRTCTTGVGWIEVGFKRAYEQNQAVAAQINDVTRQLDQIQRLMADQADGITPPDSAKVEELRQQLTTLQSKQDVIVDEGLVFQFPRTTQIILDRHTTQISGLVGTDRMAKKVYLTVDRIKEIYKVDVGVQFTGYAAGADKMLPSAVGTGSAQGDPSKQMACVYIAYDRPSGHVYHVCDGYPDFLKEPAAPDVGLTRFFPLFPLVFNEVENPEDVYPPSDVRLMMHQQREHNRSREALRQHRIANQPAYMTPKGVLSESDKTTVAARQPHSVHEFDAWKPGVKPEEILAPMPVTNIDPGLYDTNPVWSDIERITGSGEARFGGTSDSTATEAAIAEGSRTASVSSNVDDLDETLTDLARGCGEILLIEMSPDQVKRIVGPGAVWPNLSRDDVADQIFLEVVAGSSGRPNKAQDLANIERATPLLVQIPGVSPKWIGTKVVNTIDDSIDIEEAILDGLPSIMAMNAMASKPMGVPGAEGGGAGQPGTGDPASDPNAQGGQGGNNAPAGPGSPGGAQPAFPAGAGPAVGATGTASV